MKGNWELAGFIPVLGGPPGILPVTLSLCAVLLTRFGLYKFVPVSDEADPETHTTVPG